MPKPLEDPVVQKRWTDVVGELQKQQTARFFRLAYSRVVTLGDGVLKIAVTGKSALAELMKPDTRKMIEDAISKEYGQALRFEPVSADGASASGAARAETVSLERQGREDPLVQASVEVLQGRVEGVVARSRRGGT